MINWLQRSCRGETGAHRLHQSLSGAMFKNLKLGLEIRQKSGENRGLAYFTIYKAIPRDPTPPPSPHTPFYFNTEAMELTNPLFFTIFSNFVN